MKYVLGLMICCSMVGCASVSEYAQGCREGIDAVSHMEYGSVIKTCNELESLHNQKEKLERQGKR